MCVNHYNLPAAFLNAVNVLEFTTARTTPVVSSITSVVPGIPPVPSFRGTETTLTAVCTGVVLPAAVTGIGILHGIYNVACAGDSVVKCSDD